MNNMKNKCVVTKPLLSSVSFDNHSIVSVKCLLVLTLSINRKVYKSIYKSISTHRIRVLCIFSFLIKMKLVEFSYFQVITPNHWDIRDIFFTNHDYANIVCNIFFIR